MDKDLLKICKAIQEKEIEKHQLNTEETQRFSRDDFKVNFKTIEQIIAVSGRKWRINLQNEAQLINYYKNFSDYSVIGISSNNPDLIDIFGTQQNVSKVIDYSIKIGLLKCTSSSYTYISCFSNKDNTIKEYIFNPSISSLIYDNFYTNKISNNIYLKLSSPIHKYNYSRKGIDNEEVAKVLRECEIGSDLKVKTALKDEEIIELMYRKYPLLQKTEDIINYENKNYLKDPELKRRWKLKITRDKKGVITKIGIRDTSIMSNFRTHFNTEEDRQAYNKETKETYLNKRYGEGNWEEYDVKSSIYRLTYFLNNKLWIPDCYDFYEKIYGEKFKTREERDCFKLICMPLYFGSSNLNVLYNQMKFSYNLDMDKETFIRVMSHYRSKMEDAIGKSYGSKIFLYESYIYANLGKKLMDDGIDLIQIYDGFYGPKNSNIKGKCQEYLNNIKQNLEIITD